MDYVKEANRTMSEHYDLSSVAPDVLHGAIGIATESGELLDAIKKAIFYQKPADIVNVKEELGDLMWYIALICHNFGWTFEEIQKLNIEKLKKRYPDRFTAEHAENRDLAAERKVLEAAPDVMVHEMSVKNGGINMMLEHPVFGMLLTEMLKLFDQQGAQNFLEFRMSHPERGEFVCTIQRKEGKTQGQIIDELKKEVADLTKTLGDTAQAFAPLAWAAEKSGCGMHDTPIAVAKAIKAKIDELEKDLLT